LFLWAIVLSGYYGGRWSGLVSAAIAICFAAIYLSEPGALFHYQPAEATRLLVLAIVAPAIALTVGVLHARGRRALATESEARKTAEDANRELLVLRAALEQVDYGVVLLDDELRALFINRAFRKMWDLPDDKADARPAFIALLYHGRDTKAYAIPPTEIDAYVAQRMALVRRGDETPLDLALANGEVLRFKCKTLPGGGRMLSYSSITDLVRQAEELRTLATTDPLTGAYNRRHFFALAEAEWQRFSRYERPISLLMLDIDHFKAVNDQHGHDAGDRAIAMVADACRKAKRDTDVLARVGGEEFAILLPETNAADAAQFAERLRRAVVEPEARDIRQPAKVTISIGVAQASAEANSIAKLMKQADSALYAAKRQGRDRVVVAGAASDRQVA
jgi:diguanylate cyclase (GGDEF)-like protein